MTNTVFHATLSKEEYSKSQKQYNPFRKINNLRKAKVQQKKVQRVKQIRDEEQQSLAPHADDTYETATAFLGEQTDCGICKDIAKRYI